jgi:hypothetical protein
LLLHAIDSPDPLSGGIELLSQDTAGDDIAHQLQAADAKDFDEAAGAGGGETGGCAVRLPK